ncbi:MAG TPA: ADP-polyphosphate phosphotransferase [Pseudomonadales bacterium]|nr:ADP-polyphosphate phosphotransferase [Pseudomonadales bacterium]
MKIDTKQFIVEPGAKVKLKRWPTAVEPVYRSKEDYEEMLADHVKKMQELQSLLYASNEYAVLVIFQAMDAAGKDSAIKHVMSGVNPQGCQVYSFKHPSASELEHDFLWRTSRCLPERGQIGIFNRSYYEEVLIVKVHPEILKAENIPNAEPKKKAFWEHRYDSIVDWEKHLHRNGTRIVKFFLHISKDEQKKRFLERIEKPEKNWKLTLSDIKEREYWDDYMSAYQDCMSATSTDVAPWHIIPADDKKNARLLISNILLRTMKELKMSYPKADVKRKQELETLKEILLNAK